MDGAIHSFRPQQSRPEDLEAILVAREPLLTEVLQRLGKWKPGATRQHYLFIGPRGIGKTHLLCLIQHRILLDARLSAQWQPLLLPEETYRVTGIADLLLEVLKFLQAETEDASIQEVLHEIEFDDQEARVIDRSLDALRQYHRKSNKGIVLMLENLDRLLEDQIKQKSQIHLLRKILLEEEWLDLLCSSPTYLNAVIDPDQPLFEFFAVKQLGELSLEEQREMLHKLAALRHNHALAGYLDQYQSRLRALYHFTGGNPRLTVLLYELIGDHNLAGVQTELSLLLDQITPFYQSRMKDVGEQAGKILEAMALLPEGCSPTELARHARIEPATLRAQLARLEKAGCVRRGIRREKQTTYFIPERLFRIWHQMNHSRVAQGRVQYLLEFFTHWYATIEERDQAWRELTGEFEQGISGVDQQRADNTTKLLEYLVDISELDEKAPRRISSPQGGSPRLEALRDEAPNVRGSAAKARGKTGSAEVVPYLVRALQDQDLIVRVTAAAAVGRISMTKPIAEVDQVLEALVGDWRHVSKEPDWEIAHSILRSAFEFGDLDKIAKMLGFFSDRLEDAQRYCQPHWLALKYLRGNRNPTMLERQHPEMREAIGLLVEVYDRRQARTHRD
jgi:hypothetical protein